jgi:NAD+ synthase (glutamine-hydrolysing)
MSLKVFVAQLNPTVGAVSQNVSAMLDAIGAAKEEGAQVVLFPELSVPGYPPKDLLYLPEFVDACLLANETLIEASQGDLMIVWGNIARNTLGIGKPLHNSGYVAHNGQLIAQATKTHLPTYDVFDEARYFEPGIPQRSVPVFTCLGQRFALTVCEDLWSHGCFSLEEKAKITPVQYATTPLAVLQEQPVDFLLNLSASPYELGKPTTRVNLLKRIAAAEQATVIYVNQVGANDDLIFDGHSSITQADGNQWLAPGFTESGISVSLPATSEFPNTTPLLSPSELELTEALVLGIRDYVHKTGFQKVFLGLSGGIDSALTAVLAQRALGKENVVGVAMPGPYSSDHSVEDAQRLAENLGIELRMLGINTPFDAYLQVLSEGQIQQDLAEQNLQSRLRGTMLMTLSNRENGLVLTTGNKSELATGYSTLYGDSCGALAPLGDLYKTQVYAVSEALNALANGPLIPERTLSKPPSAELAPNQKDSDSLPPYPVLDPILKGILEEQLGFGDLLRLGYDKGYTLQTLERVMRNEYKRQQMPPSLKVSRKAFGSGRDFPIVQQLRFPATLEATPS